MQDGREVAFRAPCSLLRAEGEQRLCSDYDNRPDACRTYYCQLATDYRSGFVDSSQAMHVIERARALTDRIGDQEEEGSDAELLLDFAELQLLVKRHFRSREADRAGDGPVAVDLGKAADSSYWKNLFASFPEEETGPEERVAATESAKRELRDDGYTRVGRVVSAVDADALTRIMEHVVRSGWPPVFTFLHSSLWQMPRRLEPFVSAVLGVDYDVLSAVWAWRVPAGSTGRGWRPHRDRRSVSIASDGSPSSITLWIALTESAPENGCMYVLPAGFDPYYRDRLEIDDVLDVQNVLALPTGAGCALAWNHQILHWGGRTSSAASVARVSVAFEFRRAGTIDEKETIAKGRIPTFDERLAIIARQIVQYRDMSRIDRPFLEWANDLLARSADGGFQSR